MRMLLYTIVTLAPLLTAASLVGAETTNMALTFYVLSQERIEGGRFIDTPAIPQAGYVGWVADLAVTNLLDVYRQEAAAFSVMTDKNGNRTVVTNAAQPALAIKLPPEEAKRFAALTQRAVGKRLLVMLGDKPLTAPRIMMPIATGSMVIDFGSEFGGQAEADKVERDLKNLITQKGS
jgi:preprotein translocase subunit SecD